MGEVEDLKGDIAKGRSAADDAVEHIEDALREARSLRVQPESPNWKKWIPQAHTIIVPPLDRLIEKLREAEGDAHRVLRSI